MSESHWKSRTRPKGTPNVRSVLTSIAEAAELAADAEMAYRLGDDRAGRLHVAAECAHRELLRSICQLSESDADEVEPAFTELETQLLHLPTASVRSLCC